FRHMKDSVSRAVAARRGAVMLGANEYTGRGKTVELARQSPPSRAEIALRAGLLQSRKACRPSLARCSALRHRQKNLSSTFAIAKLALAYGGHTPTIDPITHLQGDTFARRQPHKGAAVRVAAVDTDQVDPAQI